VGVVEGGRESIVEQVGGALSVQASADLIEASPGLAPVSPLQGGDLDLEEGVGEGVGAGAAAVSSEGPKLGEGDLDGGPPSFEGLAAQGPDLSGQRGRSCVTFSCVELAVAGLTHGASIAFGFERRAIDSIGYTWPVGQFLACLLIVVLVVALFVLGDRALEDTGRGELGGWLLDELPAEARADALPKTFIEWFDRLFQTRAVSVFGLGLHLPKIGRSALASFVALVAAFIMWFANKGGLADPPEMDGGVVGLVLIYGGVTVFTNLIPDYLSLVESRFVLGRMSESRSVAAKLGWLMVDAAATCAIVFCFLWLSGWLLLPLVPEHLSYAVGCLSRESFTFSRMVDITIAGLTFSTPPGTLNYDVSGIYIFSSFFTSFWVWLFLGSSLLVRVAQFVPGVREFLRRACRVHDYPLRVLAVVSGLVAVVLFTVPALVRPLLPAERRGTNGMHANAFDIELCQRPPVAFWDVELRYPSE